MKSESPPANYNASIKSPGPDMIPNSVIKYLLAHVLDQILILFNSYYDCGTLPQFFGEIEMVMLHKKGNTNLPENYCGIALINTFTKLFTSMVCNRLTQCAESNNKLPETQAGFRKGRGCLDQIFCLSAIIQIKSRKIHKRYGKLYAAFFILKKPLIVYHTLNYGVSCTFSA